MASYENRETTLQEDDLNNADNSGIISLALTILCSHGWLPSGDYIQGEHGEYARS